MANVLLINSVLPPEPSHPRADASRGRKPRFFSEIQLQTTYANLPCAFAANKANRIESKLTRKLWTPWTWRQLSFLRVASSPHIEAVSFIPIDPETPQLLFACRNPEENRGLFLPPREDTKSYDSSYVLNRESCIDSQTRHLNEALLPCVKGVLRAFLNDENVRAIQLTLPSLSGRVTEVWSKSPS